VNGFLNFNIVFLFGITSAVIWVILAIISGISGKTTYILPGGSGALWKCMSPVYIWIGIFFTQAHKEERFLFPIYPLLCLTAAVSINMLQDCARMILQRLQILRPIISTALSGISHVVVTLFILLSISRSFALFKGYHGPLVLYGQLYDKTSQLPEYNSYNICIGKEWYRFPSHFFVPSNKVQVHFIQSSFRGQLPKHYSNMPDATWTIPSEMNDMNQEEPGRYVNISSCQYLVDLDKASTSEEEPNFSQMVHEWKIVASVPFLDSSRLDMSTNCMLNLSLQPTDDFRKKGLYMASIM
jgi:alpha-1,2-mannosyltransferase